MIASGKTDIGKKRRRNEDSIFVTNQPIANLPNLYIVADGMGGYNAGEVASKLAIQAFCQYLEEHKTTKLENEEALFNLFKRGVAHANYVIYQKSMENEAFKGMGTTMTLCTLSDECLYIAHVGDTRVYAADANDIVQVTVDHSYVQELFDNGYISEEDMLEHPKRHIITRAVGTYEKVKVDTFKYPLHGVDEVILCSDGLTTMISDEAMKDVMHQKDNVEEMIDALIDCANEAGGLDNIAIIIIKQGEVRN